MMSKSSIFMPVFAITFFVEATGPIPITSGRTPASAPATKVAMGLTPSSLAFSSLMTTIAAAPSLIPEALPAVTNPSGLIVRSFASPSIVEPARGPSSTLNSITSFFFLTITGTISLSNAPAFWAASAFCWLFSANSSSSSRVSPHSRQILSAVIIM